MLKTKAGNIPVSWSEGSQGQVQLRVPTNFKVHPPYAHPRVKVLQPRLVSADYMNGLDGEEVIASIVKGMTFFLVELTSEDALGRLQPSGERMTMPEFGDWAGFVGLYAFYVRKDGIIRRSYALSFWDVGRPCYGLCCFYARRLACQEARTRNL